MNKEDGREVEMGGGLAPPSCPRIPISASTKCPGEVVPGHRASILCQLMFSILWERSWFHQYLLMFSTLDSPEVTGVCPSTCSKEVNKLSLLQKQCGHPPSPVDASVFKLMLIVSFWSGVARLTSMDQLLVVFESPLAAWQ